MNLVKAILQIIWNFEFMERNEKTCNVIQISSSIFSINCALKSSCINSDCVKKGLTTNYTDCYWIKHLELQAKYALNWMHFCKFQRNLQGNSNSTTLETAPKTKSSVKKDNWYVKILAIRRSKPDCRLIDSAMNVHVYNDLRLITDFIEKPTRIEELMADRIFLGRETVWIGLALEDGQEEIILDLQNISYLPNSPSILVGLSFLNNADILYNNERHILYNRTSQKLLAFAQR